MFKTAWFLIKFAAIIALGFWLIQLPGQTSLTVQGYTLTTATGIMAVGGLVVLLIILTIAKMFFHLFSIPKHLRHRAKLANHSKGEQALSRAFSALSAGDEKTADKETRRAGNLLGHNNGLVILSEAMTARLSGNTSRAEQKYKALLENKDTAFLGLRGMLYLYEGSNEPDKMLTYARKAEQLYPKQGWIVKTLFDAETQTRHWHHAIPLLLRLEKLKIFDKDQVKHHHAALLTAMADREENEKISLLKQAIRVDDSFVPAIDRLLNIYIKQKSKDKAALSLFEKTWAKASHPDLLKYWEMLMPEKYLTHATKQMTWYEKLVALNPDSAEANYAAAEKALSLELYNQARVYARRAEKKDMGVNVYRLLAKLEELEFNNTETAKAWLEKAALAPAPKAWRCVETGRVYDYWSPLAAPHNSFNTIQWTDSITPISSEKHKNTSLLIEAA
ncbi:MAG: hypothetical protein CMH30_01710 [Micavibrio sp.]|nr:hypothetical protein [Micavibrio sp.]